MARDRESIGREFIQAAQARASSVGNWVFLVLIALVISWLSAFEGHYKSALTALMEKERAHYYRAAGRSSAKELIPPHLSPSKAGLFAWTKERSVVLYNQKAQEALEAAKAAVSQLV